MDANTLAAFRRAEVGFTMYYDVLLKSYYFHDPHGEGLMLSGSLDEARHFAILASDLPSDQVRVRELRDDDFPEDE